MHEKYKQASEAHCMEKVLGSCDINLELII